MAVVIWRFSDARAGHDRQSIGLLQALAERVALERHDLGVPSGALGYWLGGRYPPGDHLPAPDVLIGAGHATHTHLLAARRARGGRSVVLMKPSLPTACFDLCVIPEHDNPRRAGNILHTRGVLNDIGQGGAHAEDTGLILIGGPSRHVRWNDDAVIAQVRRLIRERPRGHWWLCDSPRTPRRLSGRLRALPGVRFQGHTTGPADGLRERLGAAGEVWVSEDSVSMVYEALSSGARVGLLAVARARGSRIARGIDRLVEAGWAGAPGQWQPGAGGERTFNEAARCAEWIARQWLNVS